MLLDEKRVIRSEVVRRAYSLKERNTALLAAAIDIFRLNQPWDKVKSGMTDARIREFFVVVAALWPPDTDYEELLPKPDSKLRALYLGENDPESMADNVFRFSLYADEIIIVNPFDNPHCLAERYNPIAHPEEWRLQTLRIAFHLLMLTPWINAGLVTLIPDPGDFDYNLRMKTWKMAEARLVRGTIPQEELDASSIAARGADIITLSPPEYVARMAREAIPGISDEDVNGVLAVFEAKRRMNPLLPNETLDQIPGQFTTYKTGANYEMGMFLCHAMGAFPYTNVPLRWREILSAGDQLSPSAQVWSPLTKAFGQLDFKFLQRVDPKFAVAMREEERLGSFRTFTRKLWNTVDGEVSLDKADMLARDFRDELSGEYAKAQADWDAIDRDLLKWDIPKIGGLVGAVAGLATGHYNVAIPSGGVSAIGGVSELIQAHLKRKEFRKKHPLSVFIDLEKKKK